MAVPRNELGRIAGELHDKPLQELAAVALQIEMATMALDNDAPEHARVLCEEASEALSRSLDSLRELVADLRNPKREVGPAEACADDAFSDAACSDDAISDAA